MSRRAEPGREPMSWRCWPQAGRRSPRWRAHVIGSSAVTAYDAAVGRLTADGAGNIIQGTRSLSANGTIIDETFTCTYNVNPNGTGTATCAFSVFGTTTLDIVLADDGNEFYFNLTSMPSTTGKPVIQGVGKRQSSELSRDDRG